MVIDFLPQLGDRVRQRFVNVQVSTPFSGGPHYVFDQATNTNIPNVVLEASGGSWLLIDSITWNLAAAVTSENYAQSLVAKPGYAPNNPLPFSARLAWASVQGGAAQTFAAIPLLKYYDAHPLRIWTRTPSNEKSSALTFSLSGAIDPVTWLNYAPLGSLSPPTDLIARVSFSVFEINDEEFAARIARRGIGGVGLVEG